jgi:UTP--glucose-1-phosphate uridylyltransferase
MHTMAIVTGRGKRALEDHFDVSYELEHQIKGSDKEQDARRYPFDIIDQCTFSYTPTNEMKGLGHAILTGETLIGNEPFGVILADDLCDGEGGGVLAQMVACSTSTNAPSSRSKRSIRAKLTNTESSKAKRLKRGST